MAFKVGDKVRVLRNCSGCVEGEVYEVAEWAGTLQLRTEDFPARGCQCQGSWVLVTKNKTNSIMNKVSIMFKKLLDTDTQKLIKAGLLNKNLELTGEGVEALNTIVFTANKAGLIAIADEIIAEEEKTNG